MYTPIYPSSYRHSPWPSPMRLSRPIFNDWLNLADKRIVEYTCMARNLSKSNDSSRMDGGWEVSESLVTCSPCSRIGCHVPMERATWAFPFPISPFILSGLFPSLFYIYIHLCVWYMCVYSLSLSLFLSPLAFTWRCRTLGSLRAQSVRETGGSRPPLSPTSSLTSYRYSPASVRHP